MSGSPGPPGYGEPPSHVHTHQSSRLYYHTYYPDNNSHDTMSGPQTPTPARPQGSTGAKQNALALVLPKWPEFVKKSKEGTLGAESEKSIRSVITQQCKGAIYHGYILHKMNIFDNMHPALDPRVGHNGTGPQLSRERYEAERLGALEELKTLQLKKKAAAAVGTGTPTGSPMVASSSAIPNQASSPASMSAPTPPAMTQAASSPNPSGAGSPRPLNPVNTQAGARPPVRPTGLVPPEGIIALDEMRKILGIADINARYAFLEKAPGLRAKFETSLKFYQARAAKPPQPNQNTPGRPPGGPNIRPANNSSAPSSGTTTPSSSQATSQHPQSNQQSIRPAPAPAPAPGPSTQGQARPPNPTGQQGQAPNPHSGMPNTNPNATNPNPTNAIPNRPFNLNLPPQRQGPSIPQPPPVPVENERVRRRRKLREYMREEAPGLEVEKGVDQVFSDYLDAFIDEAARGAIRLAKHRKGKTVEVKDMALFLDVTHDMTVPGFNVQLPQRQHTSADAEKKKGKAVAPRAARKGKEAE